MHAREVKRFAPSDALRFGPSPLDLARQPGADIEQLKKDVFGHFVAVDTFPVDTSGPDALTQELTEFIDCVQTGRAPRVDGEQALQAMHVADAVLQSVATHQWTGRAHEADCAQGDISPLKADAA